VNGRLVEPQNSFGLGGKGVPVSRIEAGLLGHLTNSLVTLRTEPQTVVAVQNSDPGKMSETVVIANNTRMVRCGIGQ
jgi:hypothetical protein